jgi:tRNA(fMet)-specific endonuclease VapC
MHLMLDTCVCAAVIRRSPAAVLERLLVHPVGSVGISAITLAELDLGVAKSRDRARNREALARFLLALEVAPIDEAAAAAYGPIRARLEAEGRTIGSLDMLIGAHAHSLAVPLATTNAGEFRRIAGLEVLDWLAAS